jgi:methyltransferase-like protein
MLKMQIKKTDEIIKFEEALKKEKLKQKENIKKINYMIGEEILNKLSVNEEFKKEFFEMLIKYDFKNILDSIEENYSVF